MQGTLEIRNDRLCIRYESACYAKKELTTKYSLVTRLLGGDGGQSPKHGDLVTDTDRDHWIASDPKTGHLTGLVFTNPQALPIHFERTPLEFPKNPEGVDIRYRNGAWEKLMKRGWVNA